MAGADDVPLLVLTGPEFARYAHNVPIRPASWGRYAHNVRMILIAVAAGGVLGAIARYAVGLLVTHSPTGFAWSTVLVNVTGCLLIGLLLGWHDRADRHRYLRPFLTVGVLGGYTTFSTYALDAQILFADGRLITAAGYLIGTLLAALGAVWVGLRLTDAGRPRAADSGAGEPR